MRDDNSLDRRINAYRDDLAAAHLEGLVDSLRFCAGHQARVTAGKVELHRGPDRDTPVESELIYGDVVTVYEEVDNWSWVQNQRDQYVGYLPRGCLSVQLLPPSHKITALSTFAYSRPNIKTPLPYKLFMGSRLAVAYELDDFVQLYDRRYVHKRHIEPIDETADDFVSVAERYVGVPYLWGGRTADGIDCSGLVQVAFEMAGIQVPRDSDLQRQIPGQDLDAVGLDDPQRGDLVFWPGHVGIMVDDTMLLHANAYHMEVAVEPFHATLYRLASDGIDLDAIRRPERLSAIQAEE